MRARANTVGLWQGKRRLMFVSCVGFSFLCLADSPQQQVSAQGHKISNDEFSVQMPGKPEYDKEFNQTYPNYYPYRVSVGDVHFFFLLIGRNPTVRKGYEHQAWVLKGHSIGYNSGFMREAEKDGIRVEMIRDRGLGLNGFPGVQFRIV